MDTTPEIGQLVMTYSGVAVARVQMQNIVIRSWKEDGSAFVNVQDGEHMVTFLLDRNQCRHLARLLLGGPPEEMLSLGDDKEGR